MVMRNLFQIVLASIISHTLSMAQYPLSREVKIIEQVSPTEVMVEASGVYKGRGKTDRKQKKM